MPLATTQLKTAQVLEIVAFAPILAALLLGSLPVLLAMNVWNRFGPLSTE